MTGEAVWMACPQCGQTHSSAEPACPRCGLPEQYRYLIWCMREAQRLESVDPPAAANAWRQCLPMLDPASPQYQSITQRIAALDPSAPGEPQRWPDAVPQEHWPVAVGKTIGSMIVSIVIYSFLSDWGLTFATGFVLLMLVHEMGHVLAVWHYGLSASPPIFIPFVGALINLREPPPNAKVEAVVGIGGPVLGSVGAFICYGLYLGTHNPLFGQLAFVGMILNLLNLLPVPPLDGGRVMAAVSPWVWVLGVAGMAGLLAWEYSVTHRASWIFILVLAIAIPRVWRTLVSGARTGPYYDVPRAWAWGIAAAYLLLVASLIGLYLLLPAHVQMI